MALFYRLFLMLASSSGTSGTGGGPGTGDMLFNGVAVTFNGSTVTYNP